MIKLFAESATDFTTNGIGNLLDAISCIVIEEINGEFELEMMYPITGKRFSDISLRRIIVAKPNQYSDPQPFRIYSITKPINGIVTVNAEHISYDLSGFPTAPFTSESASEALINMKAASVVNCPFTFMTNKITSASMAITTPKSIRTIMGKTLLETYGGEFEFDKYLVKLLESRGSNLGVSIRYGKNLTDLKQEENCSAVYTAIYPFWYSTKYGLIDLPEKTISTGGTYNYIRILPVDLSKMELANQYSVKPTEAELRTEAEKYISENNLGVPKISLTVEFIQLTQSDEYNIYALLETVHLGDTVSVIFPELNVSSEARCISTKYNAITNKYINLKLGDTQKTLATTISSTSQAVDKTPSIEYVEKTVDKATQLITGGLGGHVVLHSSTGDVFPNEILIMDTEDINTANKLWRWNMSGWGYSSTGYNGLYGLAATMDGEIDASFIKVGELTAIDIIACNIRGNPTNGGSININDNFIVDSSGNLTLNGSIVWGAGASPTQVAYSSTLITKPTDGTTWTSLPLISGSTWHRNFSTASDYYASFTYDGGNTWGNPIKIVGTNGTNGSDATVNDTNVFNALTSNGTMYGCFTALDNQLYINATYIQAGTVSADVTYTGRLVATNADISGTVNATTGTFGSSVYKFNIGTGSDSYSSPCIYSRGSHFSGIGGFGVVSDNYVYIGGDGFSYWTGASSAFDYNTAIRPGGCFCSGDNTESQHKNRASLLKNGGLDFFYGGYTNLRTCDYSTLTSCKIAAMEIRTNDVLMTGTFMGSSSNSIVSDRNKKNSIENIPDKYKSLFKALIPRIFKYNDGSSGRIHLGLIAQEVKEAMDSFNISNSEFAAYIETKDFDGSTTCGLRYEEFIILCISFIQDILVRLENIENPST